MLKLIKNMRRKEKEMALLCLVFVVVQIYFDLRLPDYMTELTMLIKTSGTTADIAAVGLKMLGCTAASAVLAIACGFLAAKTASGFSFAVREKLFRHVMDIGSEEMQDFSIPSLITRTTNDITQIQMIIAMGLQMMIKAPIMAVWAIIKILGKSWELSAVTAAFVVVLFTTLLLIMGSCIPRFRLVQKMTDKINRVARENLTGINVVHAFNAEEFQNEKFDGPSRGMMDLQMKNQKLFALVQPSMSLGMNGLALAIYWVGAALVNSIAVTDMAARLTMFSEVLVFSTYATYIVMSFMMLAMIFMLLPQAQVSAERINEVLDRKASIREGSVQTGAETGTVEFRNVSFRYPHASGDALTNIDFKVNRGETLAIIGATGSGKTTLVQLIPRFYDATEGAVLIDGVNVKDYSFDALYDKLGYVTQKAVLFSGTVRDNVLFGESAAGSDSENLESAIALSQAKEFVDKLPEGTNYEIEQLGRKRQRNASGDLGLRHALAPRVDPRGPLAGVDLGSSVVGLGDHRSAGSKGNLAALDDLGGVATVATSDDQGLLAQTTRTHDIELASRIDIRSEGGCLALQKLMSRDQIDHGATASNPVDAVELALLGNCLFDQIVCVHIQFLSYLARNQ